MTSNSINNTLSSLYINAGVSGNSRLLLDINNVDKWAIGADDADGNSFKVSSGGAIGTTDCLSATTNGEVRFPLTPSFAASSNLVSNVTGDGTVYTCVFANENFDQNSDFDSTSTFTAPVAGKYNMGANFYIHGLLSAHSTAVFELVVNGSAVFRLVSASPSTNAGYGSSLAGWRTSGTLLVSLAAADTAVVRVTVSGSTKVVDFGINSWFFGNLET